MTKRRQTIAAIAERQFGTFSFDQALSADYTPAAIQRHVGNGAWRHLGHGVYAIAGAPLTFESYVKAATLLVRDSDASHRTAARLHGLDGFLASRAIEVMLFDRRGNAVQGIIVHRPRAWINEDRSRVGSIPVTSVTRTLFDLAAVCAPRQVQIAFDDALRQQKVTVEMVASRLESVRRRGVRGLNVINRLVADRIKNPLEDSELEAMFRRIVEHAGLPMPVPQYQICRDDGSFVAEVDFAYPAQRVAIELDSWKHHGGRVPFERDRVKQNDLTEVGWIPLRFTKAELRSRSGRVASLVARHVLASQPPLGARV